MRILRMRTHQAFTYVYTFCTNLKLKHLQRPSRKRPASSRLENLELGRQRPGTYRTEFDRLVALDRPLRDSDKLHFEVLQELACNQLARIADARKAFFVATDSGASVMLRAIADFVLLRQALAVSREDSLTKPGLHPNIDSQIL